MIPFLDLDSAYREVRPQIDSAYCRVMESGRWILGKEVTDFETAFAAYCEADFCVGVGNGLEALAIGLESLGIGAGDEVIVPAHTFIATWLAVHAVGATPVAAEPADDKFNVTVETIAPVVTSRTKAIIVVHLYGEPVQIEPIRELARKRGVSLIEDAAQAHGARRNGVRVGALADIAAFSFYPSKNLGAFGDGGAIVTNSENLCENVAKRRNYGCVQKYNHEIAGRNSRLDALQAAFLRAKLPVLDDWNERRRGIAKVYSESLAELDYIRTPAIAPGNEPVWHLYVIQTRDRDLLQRHLEDNDVASLVHYPLPVYRTTPFVRYGPDYETRSDRLTRSILSLPMGPHLSADEAEKIASIIKSFCRKRR